MGVLDKFNLELTYMTAIAADGCPSKAGEKELVVSLVSKSKTGDALMHYHCITQHPQLCAKTVGFENVIHVADKVFQHFLAEMNSDYGDVNCFCDVRWLYGGKILERAFELKN
ncbi:hypothetical protein PR048_003986 [Dryococelus australis]|uniref:Uncharacterized protein n=1 Tax=Dryococelus australis TaxID=614101 RepID=A0ABQ9I668_9NEOP|nr:hypothetical protein PR048_003986 [Dryococelus australis]